MKLLRKSRGKWIAIASGVGLAASMMVTDYVSAETEQPIATESPSVAVPEAVAPESTTVMPEILTETIEQVEPVSASPATIAVEQQAAIEEITPTWTANTVSSVQKEIERQEALHLPEYVIQWGDTLSTIAVASNTTVEQLVTLNQIADRNLIITGQLLKGVLKQQEVINIAGAEATLLERERQASVQKVMPTWTANTDAKIKQEIERQETLRLPEYVIQWGDTLGAISRASGVSITELASLNHIQNIDLIITGNTLKGVLNNQTLPQTPVPPVEQPVPEQPLPPVAQPAPEQPLPPVEQPAPEQPLPPVEQPAPEQPLPPVEQPAPEQPLPPVEQPAPEQPLPPVEQPVPEQPLPPVEQPAPEQPLPPVEQPAPEQPLPPVEQPAPEQPLPPVEQPAPEQPLPPVEQPAPEQPLPPVEQPAPEQPLPPVEQPAPEQPLPPVEQPAPEQPLPPVEQPAPEQPLPPVEQPAPEQPLPPVEQPAPEQPLPPVEQPAPEQPLPPVTPPVTDVGGPAPKVEDDPIYHVEIRTEERREPLDFQTEEVIDADLPEGEVVETEGQLGEIIRTFEIAQGQDGTILSEKETNLRRVEPVNKVIRRGAVVDRSRLQVLLDRARNQESANYTNATWANLQTTLGASTTVFNTQAITQQQADEATAKLELALASLQRLKAQPMLTLEKVEPNELQASARVQYQLNDPDSAYVRSETRIYRNGQLVMNQAIDQLQATLNHLDLDTVYEIESILVYDRGNGEEQTVSETRKPLELQLKRVELKDIQELALMKYANGQLTRTLKLTGQEDAAQYLVRVQTANTKEMLLPVSSFQKVGDMVKVSVRLPQLVQRESERTFQEHFEFNVNSVENASPVTEEGKQIITSFAELITAITANPTGHYVLGADVSASEVANSSGVAYVTEIFKGSLTGLFEGKQYTLYDLTKPLFQELHAANIQQLTLKNVDIHSYTDKAAALALKMLGTTVSDVFVEGKVSAKHHVAGIVNEAQSDSKLENVSFKGELSATASTDKAMNVGGIVSYLQNSTVNKAAVDANITLKTTNGNNRAGGLVGHADYDNSIISNSYAKGNIVNTGTGGQVGGAVGSTWQDAQVNNVVSLMKVQNGYTFYGDANYRNASVRQAFIVEGVSTGKDSLYAQAIGMDVAQSRIAAYDISSIKRGATSTTDFDYTAIQGAQSERAIAYRNTEKLLPFYNREYIVKQGNKVDPSSKLAQVALVSVVPMQDNRFITNYYGDRANINRLALHFADGTIEYVTLGAGAQYKDSAVYEYQLTGTELLYTPNQFIQDTTSALASLVEEIKQLRYMDVVSRLFPEYGYSYAMIVSQKELMPKKLNTTTEEAVAKLIADGVDPLYLETAFKHIQNNIQYYLNSLLAQSAISSSTEANLSSVNYLVETIRTNQKQILMSLAYLNRLYSVDFDGKNIGELSMFRQDFLNNKKVSLLDWLIQFGSSGRETFNIERNSDVYNLRIGLVNGKDTVHDYLEAYRTRLTTKTANDWLKSATKAYVVEKASQENGLESVPVDLYHALSQPRHKHILLPLLTLSGEGIFVITTMTSITFGMYDRYFDMSLEQTNPELYQQKVAEVKAAVELEGERQRRFFDMWYRLANDNVKQTLIERNDLPIPTWDGYRLSNNRGWAPAFGEKAGKRMLEFFGPLGKWYRHNGAGAYAGGSYTHFVHDEVLSQYGNSVFTHEMTHNMDNSTFLGGYGRRQSAGAESYALGMLQSVTTATNQIFGWNMAVDHATANEGRHLTNRVHNLNPDRFQNQADLQEYFKGVFDVIYTLDAIEGEAFLKGTDEQKRKLFKTLALEKDTNGEGNDRIRSFTDEEWGRANFTTLADLVNNDVILTLHGNYNDRKVGRNTYQTVLMFVPIYGAITNDTGVAGNLTFKRLTFDILAEKGYEGMLGYVSNKYLNEARKDGAVFSDKYIAQKIFDGKYADFKAFKLDMLTRRLEAAKAGQLREIEFTYEGKKYTTSYENIKNLIERTAQQSPSQVQRVKEAIYRAYLLDTNDFRNSIYKAQP